MWRFAINFFTSIGLGGITEDLRYLSNTQTHSILPKNCLLTPPIPQVSSEVCSQTDCSGSSHGEIEMKGGSSFTSLFSRWEAAIPARAPARPAPPRRRATATVRVKMIARRGRRRRRRRRRRTRNHQKRFWGSVCCDIFLNLFSFSRCWTQAIWRRLVRLRRRSRRSRWRRGGTGDLHLVRTDNLLLALHQYFTSICSFSCPGQLNRWPCQSVSQ